MTAPRNASMKRFCLWCAAVLVPVLAACHINLVPPTDFTEPRTFDLVSPAPLADLPFTVEVDIFSNECSGRYKMVFREKGNQIDIDEYNRWSMPPASMLTKYLAARFAAPPSAQNRTAKPVFELDGSVLTCELNKEGKTVNLMIHYSITEPGWETFKITGTEDYRIPVQETSADAFADGMNTAAAKFADQIVLIISNELKARTAEAKDAAKKK